MRSLSVQSLSEIAAAEAFRLANTLNFCMSNIIDMASKVYEHRRKMYQGYNPTARVPCFCVASLVVSEDMERARMQSARSSRDGGERMSDPDSAAV